VKLLVVHPGASTSTSDVADGLYHGLEHHGVELVRYRLDQRIDRSHRWLMGNWRRTKKSRTDLERPTTADVFYQAGVGTIEMALRHQVDCVLVVSAMFLHPDVIILLKRAGLRVCVLFTESPYDQDKELGVAKLVDGCWTCERTSVSAFEAVNPRAGYLPHGWHPERHSPDQTVASDVPAHDVVFVGTGFHERITWLDAIDWTGIDLGLYGNWQHLGSRHRLRAFVRDGVVNNVRAAALYRRAKIGLNLYRTSMGWGKQAPAVVGAESLNPRAYELARCGAFTLSTYRAEVEDVFGDLVPTFTHAGQASALIRRWLADEHGRARVRQLLPARVADASWTQRATRVIGDLQTLLESRAA
jgi:hypothetical protein